MFCNGPGFNATVGERIRFYVISLGTEAGEQVLPVALCHVSCIGNRVGLRGHLIILLSSSYASVCSVLWLCTEVIGFMSDPCILQICTRPVRLCSGHNR